MAGSQTYKFLCNSRYIFSSSISSRTRFMSTAINTQGKMTDKKLFTPGPLGVSWSTKHAMLRDLGSRDKEFIAIVKHIRHQLVELAGVSHADYTCVPMQGSGTFSIEAVITSTVPNTGKILIAENGSYGRRQMKICEVLKIPYSHLKFAENEAVCPEKVRKSLKDDPTITNVAVVHCETSSGLINPIKEIGNVVKETTPGASFFVDAMSSFGGIPLKMDDCKVDYLVSSANKCVEGIPGFSFAICNTKHLLSCRGYSRSYSLDLVDQFESLEKTSQFRFTPPTHVMLGFQQALQDLRNEGGVEARSDRYKKNRETLKRGMTRLGFKEFLREGLGGNIITSYCFPNDKKFKFVEFYERLSDMGQVIYPGKVLDADCFRIGHIGHLFPEDMEKLVHCIEQVCRDMQIQLPLTQ